MPYLLRGTLPVVPVVGKWIRFGVQSSQTGLHGGAHRLSAGHRFAAAGCKNAVFCGEDDFFCVSSCVVLYFVVPLHPSNDQMVRLVQLVRMSDCGSEGRGFESHISPPVIEKSACQRGFFCYIFTAMCRPCLTGGVGHKKSPALPSRTHIILMNRICIEKCKIFIAQCISALLLQRSQKIVVKTKFFCCKKWLFFP